MSSSTTSGGVGKASASRSVASRTAWNCTSVSARAYSSALDTRGSSSISNTRGTLGSYQCTRVLAPAVGEIETRPAAEPTARQLAFLERIVRATAEEADHTRLLRTIIDETTEATGTQV